MARLRRVPRTESWPVLITAFLVGMWFIPPVPLPRPAAHALNDPSSPVSLIVDVVILACAGYLIWHLVRALCSEERRARRALIRQLCAMDAPRTVWLAREQHAVFVCAVVNWWPVRITIVERVAEDDLLAAQAAGRGAVNGRAFWLEEYAVRRVDTIPRLQVMRAAPDGGPEFADSPRHSYDWHSRGEATADEIRELTVQLAAAEPVASGWEGG